MVLCGDDNRVFDADEIKEKYDLPTPPADFYHEQGCFFKLCRAVRDQVSHYGFSFDKRPVFALDSGFAVDVKVPLLEVQYLASRLAEKEKVGKCSSFNGVYLRTNYQSYLNLR
jgi:hypothetical protein